MERRVVITGMGALTPVGNSAEQTWESIKAGKNGIDFITHFDTSNYKVKVAGELKDFDPVSTGYVDAKDMKRLDLYSIYAICASGEALKDSGIDLDKIDRTRFGVVMGSGIGGLITIETQVRRMVEKGDMKAETLFIPKSISNMGAGNVAIKFGAKGICESITTACATGTSCIGRAYRDVKHGYSDVAIAGGSEAGIYNAGITGFAVLKALSTSDDPSRASMPFDKERNGFVMGEGAGAVVLEELESAKARGAKIYGEIVGFGSTCDAYHITSPCPDGDGAARAMKQAIDEAGIKPEDIGYINAHGTSTHANDSIETLAIKKVFGDYAKDVAISSTKSMTGHLLGATGAVEAIIAANAVRDDFVPPTINYKVPDEECDLNYTPNKGIEKQIKYALSNTFGFGGHNAVLCIKKWEE